MFRVFIRDAFLPSLQRNVAHCVAAMIRAGKRRLTVGLETAMRQSMEPTPYLVEAVGWTILCAVVVACLLSRW